MGGRLRGHVSVLVRNRTRAVCNLIDYWTLARLHESDESFIRCGNQSILDYLLGEDVCGHNIHFGLIMRFPSSSALNRWLPGMKAVEACSSTIAGPAITSFVGKRSLSNTSIVSKSS